MATVVANDAAEPIVAGEIIVLDPREVQIGERLRDIDTAWAEALGRSMQRDGQIHAIHVCQRADAPGWHLAGPGGHRLTGARLVGIPIEARVVSADTAAVRRREAAENVFRRSNDPLERAAAIAELVRLHKERVGIDASKDGRAASAQARWQKRLSDEAADANDTMSLVYGWSDEVAEQIGVNKRTVERDLYLYRRLAPSLVARLRGARHPIATNSSQLRALAKLEADQQGRVVETLLFDGDEKGRGIKSVSDALARLSGANRTPSDPEAKRLSAFIGSFQRMGLAEKKGALAELGALLPAGTVLSTSESKGNSTRPAHDEQYVAQVREGLAAAFELLLRLSDGDTVEDDEINAARAKTQMALMSVNSGFLPTQGEAA